jgi:hypothetical protein
MDFAWVWSLIGAGVGAYFGGYLKKKGENLATHEDIEKLKEQVAAVTTTTEQIKTEISDAAWSRQKRWELKREVLLEAVKRLAEAQHEMDILSLDKPDGILDLARADVYEGSILSLSGDKSFIDLPPGTNPKMPVDGRPVGSGRESSSPRCPGYRPDSDPHR